MRISTTLTTLALAATAFAAPLPLPTNASTSMTPQGYGPPIISSTVSIIVYNHCSFPVWATSIASIRRGISFIPAGSAWSEAEFYDGHTGSSLQVTSSPDGIDTGRPILNAAYTYNAGSSLYYNLSPVGDFGYDFYGETVKLYAVNDPAQATVWVGAPEAEVTKAFLDGESDLVLTLCA